MKDKVILLIKHPLILGSSILFIGSLIASVLNYLFNLGMGRLLTVSDYGTFASLISIFNIFSVLTSAIIMIFSKYAATLVGQRKETLIGSLVIAGNLWVGAIAVFVCGILVLLSAQIANFLNITSETYILLTIAALFVSFLSGVAGGAFQGLLNFTASSFVNISSSLVKLALGLTFVYFGGKVLGAILAFFISIFSSYTFSLLILLKYLRFKAKDGFTISSLHKKAYAYAIFVFFSNIGIIALISLDIILVKHYFDPTIAGQYAALSLMGRSIFYVVAPISAVLFPLIAQKKEKKERLTDTLLLSAFLVGFPSAILSIIYFSFPEVILKIFFPAKVYLPLAPALGPFSIFIFLYSISYILNSFYLSLGKTKVFVLTLAAAIAEALFIFIWHKNIGEIINDLIASTFLLLLGLLLYYRSSTKTS